MNIVCVANSIHSKSCVVSIDALKTNYTSRFHLGPPRTGSDPGENFFGRPSRGELAKNLNTKLKRLIFSCRVTLAWSERVNLYNRQIMTLPRNAKTYYET
jgi:hypothetical protein